MELDASNTSELPTTADTQPRRRESMSSSDQRCVATLAALAIVGIGLVINGVDRDRRSWVDLNDPVVIRSDEQPPVGFKLDVNRADWWDCSTPHY